MSKDSKTYSAEEVAKAVLRTAYGVLSKSANTSHELEAGGEPSNEDAECPEYLADADIENDAEDKGDKKKKAPKADSDADPEDSVSEEESEAMEDIAEEELDEHNDELHEGQEHDEDESEPEEDEGSQYEDDIDEDESEPKDPKEAIADASKDPKKVKKAEDFLKNELGDKLDKLSELQKTELVNSLVKKMAKAEKGVHSQAVIAGKPQKRGTSLAGQAARDKHQWANQEHRRVLNESKKMPKPKLPKSEMAKGDLVDIKTKKVISEKPDRREGDRRSDSSYLSHSKPGSHPKHLRASNKSKKMPKPDRREGKIRDNRAWDSEKEVDRKARRDSQNEKAGKLKKFMYSRKAKKMEKFMGMKKPAQGQQGPLEPKKPIDPTGNMGY